MSNTYIIFMVLLFALFLHYKYRCDQATKKIDRLLNEINALTQSP
jgi:hypothetical protein